MALSKTLTANGSKGHHRFTLRVNEDSTSGNSSFLSYTFQISPIQTGWDWSGHNITYRVTIGANTYTGTISSYNGSSTVTLKSGSNIEIAHNTDGTKTITVGFNVTDNTGASYTCGNASASESFELTALHKPPRLTNRTWAELNSSISVSGELFVPYLSNKRVTITATAYDGATITKYEVYNNGVKIGESTTNQVTINFANVENFVYQLMYPAENYMAQIDIKITDNKGGVATYPDFYDVIPYYKPSIIKTSTSIKRKTGGGVVLTDNKAVLNLNADYYNKTTYNSTDGPQPDPIGTNNVLTLKYKLWENGASEPSAWQSLGTGTTITNYQINNVLYTKKYNYKIQITDSYGYTDTKEDTVPTGISVWNEYSDHVDFLKITIQGEDILDIIQRMINNS